MRTETIWETVRDIDQDSMNIARKRWDSIAKPLHSLGKLEDCIVQIAGIQKTSNVKLQKRALVIMCADNGIVAEGISQTTQDVTAIVAENFLHKKATASILCEQTHTDIYPIDIGIAKDTCICNEKIAYGTKNFAKEPAMSLEELDKALHIGINIVKELKEAGYNMIATGEMGIGNTTTSSAVASVLLQKPVEDVTGKGAGLSSEGLLHKIEVIKQAIQKYNLTQGTTQEVLRTLRCVGGFDLAGLCGVFLGGAIYEMPIVIDGFISAVAALAANKLQPLCANYMLASHVSKEPAAVMLLEALHVSPLIHADMCLGEGTGALMLFPLLDSAVSVYEQMSTFEDIQVEEYQPLE